MKTKISSGLFLSIIIFISCGNATSHDNSGQKKQTVQQSSSSDPSPASAGNDVLGDWKLAFETYDENQNKKLDPQERAKAFSNHFFLRFNADGSALVNFNATAEHAFKAKYKLSKRK